MKPALFHVLFIITCMFLLFSCARENHGPTNYPSTYSYTTETGTYTGGLAYCAYTSDSMAYDAQFYPNPQRLNYLVIDFSGAAYLPQATYNLGYDSLTHVRLKMQFIADDSHPFTATTGSMTITSFDTLNQLLAGTFHFTGSYLSSARHISNGSFTNLNYVKH